MELYRTQHLCPYPHTPEPLPTPVPHVHTHEHMHDTAPEAFSLLLELAKLLTGMRPLQNVPLDLDWSIPIFAWLNAIHALDQGFLCILPFNSG